MGKKVLFTSRRPLGRCENITAIYNAYDGDKDFIQESWGSHQNPDIINGGYSLIVADDSISYSPGKVILVTHGMSGGKSYGLKQPNPYHNPINASLIDYVVCTSVYTIPLEAEQHGVSEYKVLPLGMPRTDAYFGKVKGDGKTLLANKRAYLYVPTMRKPFEPPLPKINWEFIDNQLTDNEIMAVKRHMVTKDPILDREYKHIIELPPDIPTTPFLIDADVVITDYSSILFDAHVLGKPLILFEKEKGFVETRGMAYPYPSGYTSRYADSEGELVRLMKTADKPMAEDLLCKERSCGACDGHSAERVVNLIKQCLEDDMPKKVEPRIAVYSGTREQYEDMIPAIKSMLKNGKPDFIYLLIEDDNFPYWLPSNVKVVNIGKLKNVKASLAKILPDYIDKALWLGYNTLVVGDISEIWNCNLDGYYFSACVDPRWKMGEEVFTNTNVAMVNLKMLRETGMADVTEERTLNSVFRGHILPMPSCYNFNRWTDRNVRAVILNYQGYSCWNSEADVMYYRLMDWWRITSEVENG